jgi:hypothetical protein
MGMIKLGFISIIFFALLITGISLFFPSHIHISRATTINANKDSILAQLNNPVNWKKWYPGADTAELIIKEGKIIGINTDNLQGLIITTSNDSSVYTTNSGSDTKRGNSGWNLYKGSTPHSTTLQWFMDIYLHWYPWEKFSSLLLEKRYGTMMELGLDNIKKRQEKQDK